MITVQHNLTKAKLRAGETVFGCFIRYTDPGLVEFMGYQGWDFLVFDGEHGTLEPRDCENLVRAAEIRCVTPIVRVTTNSPPTILRFMDSGAQGLHVPWVNSVAEAESAVRSVKYCPRGFRGLAAVRAAEYGQGAPFGDYIRQANEETLVVIHIETAQAVDEVPDLVKIDGIDVIFIGPADLSHSLGVAGQVDHPVVQRAIQSIVDSVQGSPVALGIMVGSADAANRWKDRGARYIATTIEAVLNPSAKAFLKSARG